MSYQRQILELNTYCKTRLGPSKVHGVGVFALRDISKGQKLYTDMIPKLYTIPEEQMGPLFPEVKDQLLSHWPQIVNGSHFAYPVTRVQAFMNHSTEPNYDAISDLTLRDIKAGEEIFEDYTKIENAECVYPFLAKKRVVKSKA